MNEIWKDIPIIGLEGRYQASNIGRIRSIMPSPHRSYTVWFQRTGGVLKQGGRGPYRAIVVHVGRATRYLNVHRLVLLAFRGPPPKGHEACHKNGDPKDNRIKNLRWGTRVENMADQRRHGTLVRGERSGSAKLTESQVREIRASTLTYSATAGIYGVSKSLIFAIKKRPGYWAHVT